MIAPNLTNKTVRDILIVDDEVPLLQTLAKGLSALRPGMNVVTTSNGQLALEAIRTAAFDLVITDLMMPVMDGFMFLELLRDRKVDQPKVIVMSVLDGPDVYRRLERFGVDRILEKPLDLPTLIGAIDGSANASVVPAKRGPAVAAKASRILHMDDDAEVRMITGLILEEEGYIVDSASCGEEAIARFTEALRRGVPYDVVILDLHIERGMGGAETVRLLRREDHRVRVILASGSTSDPVFLNYRKYGFDLALPKPFEQAELENALHGGATEQ
jgi:CheY-like chemotaxis protein